MTKDDRDAPLSDEDLHAIDSICDAFEAAWRRGEQPRLDAFLGRAPNRLSAALRSELELLEQELARASQLATQEDAQLKKTIHQTFPVDAARHDQPSPQDIEVGGIEGYRLVAKLGAGGMGEVYLANQTEPIRRQVAVKVIKRGMDTSHVIARFEAERQALAIMDHPNIARVLDAGITRDQRPFFAMELVQGVPITEFATNTSWICMVALGFSSRFAAPCNMRIRRACCTAISSPRTFWSPSTTESLSPR